MAPLWYLNSLCVELKSYLYHRQPPSFFKERSFSIILCVLHSVRPQKTVLPSAISVPILIPIPIPSYDVGCSYAVTVCQVGVFFSWDERMNIMVLILDGNWEHVAHAWNKIGIFQKKNRIDVSCDVTIAFNKSKYLIYSKCTQRVQSYHLIKVPW